jgi:hypothetical protein
VKYRQETLDVKYSADGHHLKASLDFFINITARQVSRSEDPGLDDACEEAEGERAGCINYRYLRVLQLKLCAEMGEENGGYEVGCDLTVVSVLTS